MTGNAFTNVYVPDCSLLVEAIHIQKLLVRWPGLGFLYVVSMLLKFCLQERQVYHIFRMEVSSDKFPMHYNSP